MSALITLDAGLREVFIEEARQRVGEMRRGLGALRSESAPDAALLWRGAHTLRGNAAMAGLDTMAELAAAVERAGKRLTRPAAEGVRSCLTDAVMELFVLVNAMAEGVEASGDMADLITARLDALHA